MNPIPSKDKKAIETDATQVIKSAMNLQAHVEDGEISGGISLPPLISAAPESPEAINASIISSIAREVIQREANKARNLARLSEIQSEIELAEAMKKKEELLRGGSQQQQQQSSSPLGAVASVIGGNTRSAIIKAVLDSLPADKRAEWIERNKELLADGQTPAQSSSSQHQTQASTLTDVANLITALSREQREGLLWLLQVKDAITPQQQPQPSQAQSAPTVNVIADLVRELNQQNREMLTQLTSMFSDSVKQMQELVKEMQHESKSAMLELQQKLVEAQRELYETKSAAELQMLRERLDVLQRQSSSVPEGVLTLKDLPMIKQMLSEVGLRVGAENAAAEEARRKWDLEEKKLELAHQREDRLMQLEQERLRKTSDALNLLRTVISTTMDASKIEKAFNTGGSKDAQKVIGRIKEVSSPATAGTGGAGGGVS